MLLLLAVACDDTTFPAAGGDAIVGDSYTDVVQIFDGNCMPCHSAATATAGLDLETDPCSAIVDVPSSQGDPYVVPSDSGASVLWNRVADTGVHGGVMPPAGQMRQENVDTIAAWVDGGASCEESVAALLARSTCVVGGAW